MKRKLLEENLAFLDSTHVWEEAGLKGTGIPDRLSTSRWLRCFTYVTSISATMSKSFRDPLCALTGFSCWDTSSLPPHFSCSTLPPRIWKSNPASALKVFKSPSWIRLAVSNEAVRCLSLIVIFRIHIKVWYLIKSLPIWNHWGNETKNPSRNVSRLISDAKQGEH